jgi:hypothetical protein
VVVDAVSAGGVKEDAHAKYAFLVENEVRRLLYALSSSEYVEQLKDIQVRITPKAVVKRG